MKKLILLFLVLTLAACSKGEQTELSLNQSKWHDANITHYRFNLDVGCFCAFRSQMPAAVEVKDNQVLSIVDVNGETLSADDPMNEFILKYATLDRIFSEIDSDTVREADKLTISYDPTYGFPSEIFIDYIERAMDDELSINVTAFEPLP
jgi:hypothetical protein